MATALSGELSRRRLGTQSGDMRRESRRLKRDGYEAAAGRMALGASEQRLQEGSAVSSSEATIAERDESMARDRGLMRLKRNAVLKPEAGSGADPSGGTQSPTAQGRGLSRPTTNGSLNEARPGETNAQVYARQAASRAGAAGGAPVTTLSRPAADATLGAASGLPVLGGILDTASQVGKEAQTARGAAESSRRLSLRAAADRITDPEGAEPGNLKDLINAAPKARQADMPGISGPPRSAIIGPLQQALNESKARREGYAADSVAAGKLTAGLTTAPTPRLNTELGRRTLGATAAATAEPEEPPTSPAPTLTRPEMTGRLNAKFYGPEGYVDPKHAAKVAEMEKTKKAREEKNRINMGKGSTKQPAMDRLFGPKPSFLQGSLAGSYYDALNK